MREEDCEGTRATYSSADLDLLFLITVTVRVPAVAYHIYSSAPDSLPLDGAARVGIEFADRYGENKVTCIACWWTISDAQASGHSVADCVSFGRANAGFPPH